MSMKITWDQIACTETLKLVQEEPRSDAVYMYVCCARR